MELRVITPSETSKDFHQAMVNAMEVSFCKYGPVAEAVGKIDELASLKKRIQKYEEDGNTDWLVDAANFAMIIFMHKGPEAFRPTSAEESPGLVTWNGAVTNSAHTPQDTPAEQAMLAAFKKKSKKKSRRKHCGR